MPNQTKKMMTWKMAGDVAVLKESLASQFAEASLAVRPVHTCSRSQNSCSFVPAMVFAASWSSRGPDTAELMSILASIHFTVMDTLQAQ